MRNEPLGLDGTAYRCFEESLVVSLGGDLDVLRPEDKQLIKEAWTNEVKEYYRSLSERRKLIKIGTRGRLILAVPIGPDVTIMERAMEVWRRALQAEQTALQAEQTALQVEQTARQAEQTARQAEQTARQAVLDRFFAQPAQSEAPDEASSEDEDEDEDEAEAE